MQKEISEYQQLGATVIRQCVDADALVKLSSAVAVSYTHLTLPTKA